MSNLFMKKILTSLAILTASANFLSAQGNSDAVLQNTLDAKKLISEAADSFNSSIENLNAANRVLMENLNRSYSASNTLSSLQSDFSNKKQEFENIQKRFAIIEESYKQNGASLSLANENFKLLDNALPMGVKRIELAEKLYKKSKEYVSKNLGSNNSNKRYLDASWANFLAAKNNFQITQENIRSLGVSLNIAKPRMNGVQASLTLAKDFLGKIKSSLDPLEPALLLLETDVKKLSDTNEQANKNYTNMLINLGEYRMEYTKASFGVHKFIMNDLVKNEKYFDTVFEADPFYLASLSVANYANDEYSKTFAYNTSAVAGISESSNPFGDQEVKQTLRKANIARSEPASESAEFQLNKPSAAQSEKDAALQSIYEIENLTSEIIKANFILSEITSNAYQALSKIEESERMSENLLRETIFSFGKAQELLSNAEIFKNTLAVYSEQSKSAMLEFEKLYKSAEESGKTVLEKSKESLGKISEASAALK